MITKREKNDGNERSGSQCDHCNRGHIDKVDQSDYRKITQYIVRKLVVANLQLVRKQ